MILLSSQAYEAEIKHAHHKQLYDYKMEMTNRFKGLDLIDRLPEELWKTEVRGIVPEAVIKTTSKKYKCKKAKWLSDEILQIAEKRR